MPRIPESILVVEGPDDREVIFQLCNAYGLDNRSLFSVEARDGVDELLRRAAIVTSAPTVGYVLDADGDPAARWFALRQKLLPNYPDLPEAPVPGGLIIARHVGGPSRLGVWLMPDNRLPGMMEDFLLTLAPPDDVLVPAAKQALTTLPERRFSEAHHTKALLATWLAWQEEPGARPGLAITRHILRPDHPEAARFISWLKELFAPGAP